MAAPVACVEMLSTKGHCSRSIMSGLLDVTSMQSCTEKPVCMTGAIPCMAAIILAGLLWAGRPVNCKFGGGFG